MYATHASSCTDPVDPQTPFLFDERGPEALAYTHSTDGQILPFIEVPCDRVRSSIRPVIWGGDARQSNFLLGRALGRVMAHEFYHVLAKTSRHGRTGIAKHSLSAAELISDELRFAEADKNLLRMRLRAVPTDPNAVPVQLP